MSSVEPIIEVTDIWKSFDGVQAVGGVSFTVLPGQVVGFIGANGAGKTTTMRIMATLDVPDRGSARIGPWDVVENPNEVRRLIGWMPDSYGAYSNMSVFEYLDFGARACGFRKTERRDRVADVMQFADLTPLADRPVKGLSKGMAQRLCFGRALLQNPKVLILDEPAAGLDPKARIEFKNLVQILASRGSTIFISSHILSELGEMCDSLLFIDQGRIVHHGTADSLRHKDTGGACMVDILVAGPVDVAENWLVQHPGWNIQSRIHGGIRAEFESPDPEVLSVQLNQMVRDGVRVADFHKRERRLEEVFVDVLRQRTPELPPPLPIS